MSLTLEQISNALDQNNVVCRVSSIEHRLMEGSLIMMLSEAECATIVVPKEKSEKKEDIYLEYYNQLFNLLNECGFQVGLGTSNLSSYLTDKAQLQKLLNDIDYDQCEENLYDLKVLLSILA